MYYIGLDVHKKTISYCVKDASGQNLSRWKNGSFNETQGTTTNLRPCGSPCHAFSTSASGTRSVSMLRSPRAACARTFCKASTRTSRGGIPAVPRIVSALLRNTAAAQRQETLNLNAVLVVQLKGGRIGPPKNHLTVVYLSWRLRHRHSGLVGQ